MGTRTRSAGSRGNQRAWLAAGCLAGASACTPLAPEDETFTEVFTNAPTAGRSGDAPPSDLPPEWACLDEERSTPDERAPGTENRNLLVLDYSTRRAPSGAVSVKWCNAQASDCSTPGGQGIEVEGIPGLPGPLFAIQVPVSVSNFYLLVEAGEQYVPSSVFAQPLEEPTAEEPATPPIPPPQLVLRKDTMADFLQDLDVLDETLSAQQAVDELGTQVVFGGAVQDCFGNPAEGARLEVVQGADRQDPDVLTHWAVVGSDASPTPGPDARTGRELGLAGFAGLRAGAPFTLCGEYEGRYFGRTRIEPLAGQLTTSQVRAEFPCPERARQ